MESRIKGERGSYLLKDSLGRKSKFGGVLVGVEEGTETRVTVKRLERFTPSLLDLLVRLSSVEHRGVAKVLEAFVGDDGCLYVVREYVEGTDLKSVFVDKTVYGKLDEMSFVRAGCSVLGALQAVHALGIVHRDIKPSNIVVRHGQGADLLKVDYSDVCLIDFEQACAYPSVDETRTPFALIYSPPEMILKRNALVGPQADIFALGVSLYHLVMGKTPYTDCNPEVLINLQLTYPMKKPSRMEDSLYEVLSKAAYKEPFRLPPRRLSAEEIDETLRRGVAGRYSSAEEMLVDLRKVDRALKPASWLGKLFDI